MHDSRQRRRVAKGIDAKTLVRNVIMLAIAVTIAFFLIPTGEAEEEPSGVVQSVVRTQY